MNCEVTFINIVDPYNIEPSPEPTNFEATAETHASVEHGEIIPKGGAWQYESMISSESPVSGLDALSAAARGHYYQPRHSRDSRSSLAQDSSSVDTPMFLSGSQDLRFILNSDEPAMNLESSEQRSITACSPIDPELTRTGTSDTAPVTGLVAEREMAFLLRRFSETTGHW